MINPITQVQKYFALHGTKRSPEWHKVEKMHIAVQGWCMYCGGTQNLQVHHVEPFHLDPTKELDMTNLITLCEKIGSDCHLHIGHLGNWKNFNPQVRVIANSSGMGHHAS